MTQENDDGERMPPQDIVAEQAVLGSMLLAREAIADATEILTAEDFYRPAHRVIFDLCLDLYVSGEPVDPITLHAVAAERKLVTKIGTATYLHTLIATVATPANAGYYAEIVRDKALLRRLVEAGTKIVQIGYGADALEAEGEDASEALNRSLTVLSGVATARASTDLIALGDMIDPAVSEIEAIASNGVGVTGVPTGFDDLDDLIHGLHPGQLVIVAGRPGAGKSTVGLDFIRSASLRHALPSVLFSLEMSHTEIVMRLISAEARVPLRHIRAGTLGDDAWDRIARRLPDLLGGPVWINDSASMTPIEMRTQARRLASEHPLRLIVVDYLQLMTSGKRADNRQQDVADMSRSLKLLAKELEVPVVAIAQLNRNPEGRADKKPMLSDLRESGALEQDADVVILLHREEMYDKETPRAGEADLIVAKQRNGPTATIAVASQLHYSRFVDMARDAAPVAAAPHDDWATRAAGQTHEEQAAASG